HAARNRRPVDRDIDHEAHRRRERNQGRLLGRRHARRQAWQHRSACAALQGEGHGKAIRGETAHDLRSGVGTMSPFDLAQPSSLAEAIKLLDPDDPTVRPFAGGTALMLMMKAGVFRPTRLISLGKIEKKFSTIAADKSGLRIGAMTTLSTLEQSNDVK